MADRDFSAIVSRVNPSVPGCPYPMIVEYIRDSAIRVCERTLAWRYQPALFNLTASVAEYTYSKPANADVHAVFDVLVNSNALQKLTLEQATYQWPEWTAQESTPAAICQLTPDKYIILPTPDNQRTYEVLMFLALKPKRTATGMEEVVFNELEDVIIHGTLQQLLVLPNTNWSDRELAAYHAKQYLFHLTERRARANLGNMRGTMTARLQSFGV